MTSYNPDDDNAVPGHVIYSCAVALYKHTSPSIAEQTDLGLQPAYVRKHFYDKSTVVIEAFLKEMTQL